MGGYVDFRCKHCRYEETDMGVGQGINPSPRLALFRCIKCKSTGSTWVKENEIPRCGKPAQFVPKEGIWE